ncbi:hypothetical protein ACFC18_49010 [Streptomyces sp. NPDC056121]|uniref:hypothetical protein n=1 Tax=Streptomyces sp. NPDC056121 TaxID=3345718 RepID=UPI0035D98E97
MLAALGGCTTAAAVIGAALVGELGTAVAACAPVSVALVELARVAHRARLWQPSSLAAWTVQHGMHVRRDSWAPCRDAGKGRTGEHGAAIRAAIACAAARLLRMPEGRPRGARRQGDRRDCVDIRWSSGVHSRGFGARLLCTASDPTASSESRPTDGKDVHVAQRT